MLPLQIIVILGILFLLVLCCMIAAQLASRPMPATDDEVVRSVELAPTPIEFLRSPEQRSTDQPALRQHWG